MLRRCLPRDYDEERRLLYVAITRAEQHVLFAGGEDPNTFLKELPVEIDEPDVSIDPVYHEEHVEAELPFAVTTPDGPISHSPHSSMDEAVFEETGEQMEPGPDEEPETRGMDFGAQVHDFAEAYTPGEDVTPFEFTRATGGGVYR